MLRAEVPRTALKTPFHGRTVRELAQQALEIAGHGLSRRARTDSAGTDEVGYLDILRQIADSGRTPAEEMLDAYRSRWNGSVDPMFGEYAY